MKFKSSITIAAVILTFSASAFGQGLPSRYHSYLQTRNLLTNLRNSHSDIMKLDTVGYSTRLHIPMLRVKISNSPNIDQDKPAAFICGGVHANEVLGPEVVIGFIQDILLKHDNGDAQVNGLIDSLEIFAVPFINPEGHVVVENGDLEWRKNQCDNDSNGIFNYHDGVDNNRNYDIGWSNDVDPRSSAPESVMYKGTMPFTQSENRAMRDFGLHYKPVVALDYHSPVYGLGEVAYYPWYWRPADGGNGPSPDEAMMSNIARQFASLIINDRGDSTYQARRALVDHGDFNCFFYGNFGSVVFTVEVSDTTIQHGSMVDGIVSRNLPAIYFLLSRSLQGRITGVVRDSVTLEPLEAEVRVLERNNQDINPRLSRPDNGRYNRILSGGSYSLAFVKDGYRSKILYGVSVSNTPVENNVLLSPLYPRPPAPTLIFPSNGFTITQNTFTFDWTDAALASSYLIEVANDTMFSSIVLSDSNVTTSQYAFSNPLTNGQYCWRVRPRNSNGWGPYSLRFRFIVDSHSSIGDSPVIPSKFELYQNYPNPFNSSTMISYNLNKPATVDLNIYSILGDLVYPLVEHENQSPGNHSYVWTGKDIRHRTVSSGVYLYKLEVGAEHESRAMVLMK